MQGLNLRDFRHLLGYGLFQLVVMLEGWGLALEDCAGANLEKMHKRFPTGTWNAADAAAKKDNL
jgi:hypothetical protein